MLHVHVIGNISLYKVQDNVEDVDLWPATTYIHAGRYYLVFIK